MGKTRVPSKLMRFVSTPGRILGKARDFYVRNMNSCADGGRYGHVVSYPGVHFVSFPVSFRDGGQFSNACDDFKELVKTASGNNLENSAAVDVILRDHKRRSVSKTGSKKMAKSCSVQMGRIDEDKAYEFGEDGGDINKAVKIRAGRSHSVGRKIGF